MTIEERIVTSFMKKLADDDLIPREVVQRIEALWKQGQLKTQRPSLKPFGGEQMPMVRIQRLDVRGFR